MILGRFKDRLTRLPLFESFALKPRHQAGSLVYRPAGFRFARTVALWVRLEGDEVVGLELRLARSLVAHPLLGEFARALAADFLEAAGARSELTAGLRGYGRDQQHWLSALGATEVAVAGGVCRRLLVHEPEPTVCLVLSTDSSHQVPCRRCGTLNLESARFCVQCGDLVIPGGFKAG